MSAPPKKKYKPSDTWKQELQNLNEKDPVFSLPIDSKDAPDLEIQLTSLFENMIYPLPAETFMEACFRRKALHITSKDTTSLAGRVASIVESMNQLDPSSILRETSSENVFVWLLDQDQQKIQSIEVDSVDTAIALHKAGHATYCRAPPHVEQPIVSNLLRGTGMGCGNYDPSGESSTVMGRGEVEVFMGTSCHTTDWHFDFQEDFTLQLSGSKKWTLQQGLVQHPLRGCTPHYKAPEVVESQLKAAHLAHDKFQFGIPQDGVNAHGNVKEVVLKPGDMLYFPAGMWHKVETVEAGVSINVSLMATNYAALTCQALHHYLLTKPEWRQSVVSGVDALQHLQNLLTSLPSEMEEMTRTNFAEAILPPVLQYPPAFEVVDDDNQWGTVKDGCEQEVAERDDNDEEEVEINVNSFEIPAHWSPDFSRSGRLVVNKLASLLRMTDITSFYNNSKMENQNLYVLNVNYGGNEMHESAVRVILRDSNDNLKNFVDGQARNEIVCDNGISQPLYHCLVYYGFFLWQLDAKADS